MKSKIIKIPSRPIVISCLLLISTSLVVATCWRQTIYTCLQAGVCVASCQNHYCPPPSNPSIPWVSGVFAMADCTPPDCLSGYCGQENITQGTETCVIPVLIKTWVDCTKLFTYRISSGTQTCPKCETGEQGNCPPCGVLASR